MKNHAARLFHLLLLLVACTAACTVTVEPAPTPATGQTLDLHIQVTDGQHPLPATITLHWPDTGGDFAIGPTADIVLPIPADGAQIQLNVTAPGYLTWTETLTPTRSLNLIVRLIEQ